MRNARILTLVAIAILVFPSIAAAQTPSDLNALAQYFPAETPILISIRTDDAFIDTLDSVIERVRAAVPDAAGGETLTGALDELTEELFPGGTFEEDLQPLLGETASLGVSSTEGMMGRGGGNNDAPTIVALSIQDSAAVIAAITEAAGDNIVQTEGDGFTVLTPADDDDEAAVIVRDDVMLLYVNTDTADAIAAGGVVESNLGATPDFASALALLPEPTYNVTVYIDLLPLVNAAMESDPEAAEAMGAISGIYDAIGKQVWGFTILGGDSPTIDIASQITDMSVFDSMGLMMGSTTPVDLAFATRIPADTPLAVIGTNLQGSLSSSASSLQFVMQANQMADSDFDPKEFEQSIKEVDQAFTQLTGLDFEEDVLSWMTGEYALFLGLNPQFDTSSQFGIFQAFPVDFGFVIEAGDAAQAQATVAGLTQAIETSVAQMSSGDVEAEIAITNEEIGGADVTVVTITAENAPWPVELLMGANSEVFALGTRSAVRAILAPDGGLPSNSEFTRTSAYILPDAVSVGWLNTAGLLPLADLITAFGSNNENAAEEADQARSGIGLFSSGSFSSSFNVETGVSLARLVLTFSEE